MHFEISAQLKVARRLLTILETVDEIDNDVYVDIINACAPGMASKLRLVPDRYLASKLAHLYEVCCIVEGRTRIASPENLSLVSFENMNSNYRFDSDLVMVGAESDTIYLIDVTASRSRQVYEEKMDKLKTNSFNLKSELIDVVPIVHVFNPYHYNINIDTLLPDTTDESAVLSFVSLMTSKSSRSTERIYKNIDRLYDSILPYLTTSTVSDHFHDKPSTSEKLVTLAADAAPSNSVSTTVSLLASAKKKSYLPYVDCLRKICSQAHTLKSPFKFPICPIKKTVKLNEALSSLSDDLLVYSLSVAMETDKIVCMRTDRTFVLADRFPKNEFSNSYLPSESEFNIVCKYVSGHIFSIVFSLDEMDANMRRIVLREKNPVLKVDKDEKASVDSLIAKIKETEGSLASMVKSMSLGSGMRQESTVWDKMTTIAELSKRDTGAVGEVASNLLQSACKVLKSSVGGTLVSHNYSVANSFAASLKTSSKDNAYYIGINNPYDSITIVKMNSSQDSFKTRHYCVISRESKKVDAAVLKQSHRVSKGVHKSEFYTMNSNELVHMLKVPYMVMSLLTWDIESNLIDGTISNSEIINMSASSILHTVVNRDQFAQASQQSRYFYVSAIGFGSDPKKITEKFDFFTPRSVWEFVYVVRMLKMGLSLSILRDADALTKIMVDGELSVAFPHSLTPSRSFSQSVSSMYYCNIFNKFRSYQEIAAAQCFTDLDEELTIYKDSKRKNRQNLVGMSAESERNILNLDYLASDTFFENEFIYCRNLALSKPKRFSGSAFFMIAASRRHIKPSKALISEIYKDLGKSPIEACTLRGSMDHNPSSDERQAIRAASSMLEEMYTEIGLDPELINKSPLMAQQMIDNLIEKDFDFSILTAVVRQMSRSDIVYRYRITPKDQVGTREISVLNAAFRLGALYFETISRRVSDSIKDVDILENPNKDIVFEDAVKSSMDDKDYDTVIFDNSDQKRWGPNHMLHFFMCTMLGALPNEPGLIKLCNMVAQLTLRKRAKFPESLINLFNKYKESEGVRIDGAGLKDSNSDTLKRFFADHASDMFSEKFDMLVAYGMCQGIYHSTSSVVHGVMVKTIQDSLLLRYNKSLKIKSFVTSDDATRISMLRPEVNKFEYMRVCHNTITSTGNLFNIIRNDSKSAQNLHIAELNSVFFKRGRMATPSLKQRIAKIDVGEGSNHYEDYLSSLSFASNYFTAGGSYVGTVILSIINITLHTEQWNRWDFATSDHYYKPVEAGGFPVIEPFSTVISGALSNMYLRSKEFVSPSDFSKLYANSVATTPESFELKDFTRITQSKTKVEGTTVSLLKNAGALGIFSLVRTSKKLSQFDRRNKLSTWNVPDSFATLDKTSSSASNFIFNVSRTAGASLHDDAGGINSFYIRFTDPWVSATRLCYKISDSSPVVSLGLEAGSKVSYSLLKSSLLNIKFSESEEVMTKMVESTVDSGVSNVLIDQMVIRLRDSEEIFEFISNQECAEFLRPTEAPSTIRLSLKGQSAADTAFYTLSLIKHLSGEASRKVITEATSNHLAYDDLPKADPENPVTVSEAIILTDNCMNIFNKFIRKNTKLICAGKPSDLSSVCTLLLKNKFTESSGVRLVGRLKIIGDKHNSIAFTNWYQDLALKSRKYLSDRINNTLRQSYADVVKYGVVSEKAVVTEIDRFDVVEHASEEKMVRISSSSRSSFVSAVKNWSCCRVSLNFSHKMVESLFSSKLLNRSEYLVADKVFARVCYTTYINVEINNKSAIHVMYSNSNDSSFIHAFLYEDSSQKRVTLVEESALGTDRFWVKSIADMVRTESNSMPNRMIKNGNDSIIFIPIGVGTSMKPELLSGTSTIALVNNGLVIPVCHATPVNVLSMKKGYEVKHLDIVEAVSFFLRMSDETKGFTNLSTMKGKNVKQLIDLILFKNSYNEVSKSVSAAVKKIANIELSNVSVDIIKMLLISNESFEAKISPTRLYTHINNHFTESKNRTSYLTSLGFEDETLARDELNAPNDYTTTIETIAFSQGLTFEKEPDVTDVEVSANNDESDSDDDFSVDVSFPEIDLEDYDDMDFEQDEDEMEDAMMLINQTAERTEDAMTIVRTVRTNYTLNAVDETPFEIMRYITDWSSDNKPKLDATSGFKLDTLTDVVKVYLQVMSIGSKVEDNLMAKYYNKESIITPAPLSLIAVLEMS